MSYFGVGARTLAQGLQKGNCDTKLCQATGYDAVRRCCHNRKVVHVGHAMLPLLRLLRPTFFRFFRPVVATKISILNYFETHDFVGDPKQLAKLLPGFEVTTMKAYLMGRFVT